MIQAFNLKYIWLLFCSFVLCLRRTESCQFQNEICICIEDVNNVIQMKCLENQLNYSINLDFNQLYMAKSNKWTSLTVKNKFIIEIHTSETQNKLLSMIKILTIEDCNMNKLKGNSFLGMASLNELYLNNDQLETIENDCFNGLELNLKILVIASNQIKIINKQMLMSLIHLRHLRLNLNDLEEIDTEAFNTLTNLTKLKGSLFDIILFNLLVNFLRFLLKKLFII